MELRLVEFDLTVRVKGYKEQQFSPYQPEKEPELEVKEELKFNSQTASSVIRKILDYLND